MPSAVSKMIHFIVCKKNTYAVSVAILFFQKCIVYVVCPCQLFLIARLDSLVILGDIYGNYWELHWILAQHIIPILMDRRK